MINGLVYLSGGMSDLSFDEAMEWRMDVKEQIENITEGKWKCFNPMEHFSPHSEDLPVIYGTQLDKYAMDIDLCKLRQSSVVILDLNHPRSIGTNVELGIALERRIPVIAFCDHDAQKDIHSWHRQICSVIVDDYDSAVYEFITHFANND